MPLYTVALEGNAYIIISKYACCKLEKFWRDSLIEQAYYKRILIQVS